MEKELSAKELGDKLGLSSMAILNWIKKGCPHKRIGLKKIRFLQSEVQKWLDEMAEKKLNNQ